MKRQEIIKKLISEGFTEKTLVNFSDKQLNTLSHRILGESDVMISKKDPKMIEKIDSAKKENKSIETYESEKLKGKQHKLDKNKNGKLDSDDFKKLRSGDVKEQSNVDHNLTGLLNWINNILHFKTSESGDHVVIIPSSPTLGNKFKVSKNNNPVNSILKYLSGIFGVEIKQIKMAQQQNTGLGNVARKNNSEISEWVGNLAEQKYHSFTSKNEIMEMIKTKLNEQEFGSKVKKGHNNVPEFMTYDSIVSSTREVETPTKPKTAPTKPDKLPLRRRIWKPDDDQETKPKAGIMEKKSTKKR